MLYSGIIPVLTGSSQVAICNVGQEITVFGLVFANSTTTNRTVVLSLYRQVVGSAATMQIDVGPKGKVAFDKPISLQPGDHLDVSADATGVSLLWSQDQDTGANPVATGFTIRGTYSNIASYAACDIVIQGGASYVAIQNSTGKDPATQPAYWMLMLDSSSVSAAVSALVNGAPANLDTLGELAAAIGNDPAFATTMSSALALKANLSALASVALTGNYNDLLGVKKIAARRLFFSRELS